MPLARTLLATLGSAGCEERESTPRPFPHHAERGYEPNGAGETATSYPPDRLRSSPSCVAWRIGVLASSVLLSACSSALLPPPAPPFDTIDEVPPAYLRKFDDPRTQAMLARETAYNAELERGVRFELLDLFEELQQRADPITTHRVSAEGVELLLQLDRNGGAPSLRPLSAPQRELLPFTSKWRGSNTALERLRVNPAASATLFTVHGVPETIYRYDSATHEVQSITHPPALLDFGWLNERDALLLFRERRDSLRVVQIGGDGQVRGSAAAPIPSSAIVRFAPQRTADTVFIEVREPTHTFVIALDRHTTTLDSLSVLPRRAGWYELIGCNDRLLLHERDAHGSGRLSWLTSLKPFAAGRELIHTSPEEWLRAARCTDAYLVAAVERAGQTSLRSVPLDGGTIEVFELPFARSTLLFSESGQRDLSFSVFSFEFPPRQGSLQLSGASPSRGANAEAQSRSRRRPALRLEPQRPHEEVASVEVAIADESGRSIPYTLISPPNAFTESPIVIQVYGAYGQVLAPPLSDLQQTLLRRGFRVALAHVRGGGFGGPGWHLAARGTQHDRTIDDLLAVSKTLRRRYPRAPLTLHGRSAGGLVAAAALRRAPQRFSAVVLEMPFLDPRGALHCDPTAVLCASEQHEWGDGKDDALLNRLNPTPSAGVEYPPILVIAARDDSLTPLAEALGWIAVMRSSTQGPLPLALRVENGDHTGPRGWAAAARLTARITQFLSSASAVPLRNTEQR